MSKDPEDGEDGIDRDRGGRFRSGARSPNPKGRPRKATGVDGAMMGALSEKVLVNDQGKRRRKSKLAITATQIANKGASGDLRAAKMVLDQARKAEERAENQAARAPVMTESDAVIAARIVAQIAAILREGGIDETEAP